MKKDKLINIFIALMIFVGLSVMFYPVVSDMWNTYRNSLLISSHKKDVNDLSKKQTEQIWNEAVNYNKNHKENFIKEDVFTNLKKHTKSKYDSYLNISKNGVMGTIVIPKINVEIPIYHGTGEKELQTGVGHMEGTSLPVGGTSSHCVLSAHRGLPSAKLFTDLDKMKKGDLFFLHILDKTLAYKVEDIFTVKPNETDKLSLIKGKDYVTLLTCTPYAVNTHRLLVRGVRTAYKQNQEQNVSILKDYRVWILIGTIVALIIVNVFMVIKNKKKKRSKK
ncbi:sortase family protein [Kandleria vitulina DSM 20405]|uniref:Sortase family protein n=1 Tax=Kandleria vitulina DSM 20405 TaxID=1410657 RepID=A0A0R2HEZ8_9FIRM|nr:class C sortase [Kandleria vitulina]KRN51192.1 sortase family protein [Kandleria vitulina DSM 20405]